MPTPGMTAADVNLRAILRIVLVIVGVVLCLYVLYLLRRPIGWIVLATFIAVAMSAPVNLLARHMHRGLAIALAYLGLLAVPILLALILVPPIATKIFDGVEAITCARPDYVASAVLRSERNTTFAPSGEKAGWRSFASFVVRQTGAPPAVCCTQMSRSPLPLRSEAYATSFPSGGLLDPWLIRNRTVSRVNRAGPGAVRVAYPK